MIFLSLSAISQRHTGSAHARLDENEWLSATGQLRSFHIFYQIFWDLPLPTTDTDWLQHILMDQRKKWPWKWSSWAGSSGPFFLTLVSVSLCSFYQGQVCKKSIEKHLRFFSFRVSLLSLFSLFHERNKNGKTERAFRDPNSLQRGDSNGDKDPLYG